MTARSSVLERAPASAESVLLLAIDEQGRIGARGVPLAERGPLQVFVDGMLYDRDDLARATGQQLARSDADLVLAAYERRGDALFRTLRGSFTIAVVDRARGMATVVRDPLGSHPLFYTACGAGTCFAASPLPLLEQPGVSRVLNRVALADQLCKRWPRGDETFFEAIHRVPPGARVILQSGRRRVERYWNDAETAEWLTREEVGRFDEHLDRAVRRCLQSGPTGIFLSGGFDSVSVAAVAADIARHAPPLALSLAFPDPGCDERVVQASVARQLNLPLHLVDFADAVGPRGLLAEALDLNRDLGAPLFNSWMPAYLALARHGRARGIDAVLTGEGGDEWLGVSPYLTADLIRRGDIAGVVRLARTWRRSFDSSPARIIGDTIWRYGLRPLAGAMVARVAPGAWDRSRAARLTRSDPAWIAPDPALRAEQQRRALDNLAPARPRAGFYAREARVFLDHPLMSWLFEEQHQFGRRLGLRYLHPYWDADLLIHLYRTPPEVLNSGDRAKGLLRAAIARRFPGLGFETQRKVTAHAFYGSILAREAPPLAERYSDFAALGDLGVVDAARARAFVTSAFDGNIRGMGIAWNLVNVETWVRGRLGRQKGQQ